MRAKSVATMRDVAAAAGVGITTVSRVVNDEPHVRAQVRKRVLAAIDELSFRPSTVARMMRPGQRSKTIALIIEDIANPFYSSIAHGVEEVAQRHGSVVFLGVTGRDYRREERLVDEMVRRKVDGLLIVPALSDHGGVASLAGGVPSVYLDRQPRGIDADTVVLANEKGARDAVDWLIDRGNRRIGYLGGQFSVDSGSRRIAGYRAALAAADITLDESIVVHGLDDSEQAAEAVGRLVLLDDPPTALFTDNNRMTVGALTQLHRLPHQLEVAGFDDVELAALSTSPLALVTHDDRGLGRQAATLLFGRIEGEPSVPQNIVIETSLIVYRA